MANSLIGKELPFLIVKSKGGVDKDRLKILLIGTDEKFDIKWLANAALDIASGKTDYLGDRCRLAEGGDDYLHIQFVAPREKGEANDQIGYATEEGLKEAVSPIIRPLGIKVDKRGEYPYWQLVNLPMVRFSNKSKQD